MSSSQDIFPKSELLTKKRQKDSSKINTESFPNQNKKPKLSKSNTNKNFRIIEPYRSLGTYTDNNKIYFFYWGKNLYN